MMRYERKGREGEESEGNFNFIRIANPLSPITCYTYDTRGPNLGPHTAELTLPSDGCAKYKLGWAHGCNLTYGAKNQIRIKFAPILVAV